MTIVFSTDKPRYCFAVLFLLVLDMVYHIVIYLYRDVIYLVVIREVTDMDLSKAVKRYIPMSETMFYILLSLREPNHGYGIMQQVKELTDGRVSMGAGTIYQSIGKLEGDGLISPVREKDRKKIYSITDLGTEVLTIEAKRIRELYRNTEGLL